MFCATVLNLTRLWYATEHTGELKLSGGAITSAFLHALEVSKMINNSAALPIATESPDTVKEMDSEWCDSSRN